MDASQYYFVLVLFSIKNPLAPKPMRGYKMQEEEEDYRSGGDQRQREDQLTEIMEERNNNSFF